MASRRDFLKQASALVVAGVVAPDLVAGIPESGAGPAGGGIVAATLNLSVDICVPDGINMAVLYLDDKVIWRSHPEVASEEALAPEALRSELESLRTKGIEPIPAINFSAANDQWMGKYSRMLSSGPYYRFCKDIIAEAIEIFDRPRFIHFGMQYEGWEKQQTRDRIVYRQDMLWWSDLHFYISEAMNRCVRPWVWADTLWRDPDKFFSMMPRNVVLSNWSRTGSCLDTSDISVKAFGLIDAEGYDQIPAAVPTDSRWTFPASTAGYCSAHISGKHLLGFISDNGLND